MTTVFKNKNPAIQGIIKHWPSSSVKSASDAEFHRSSFPIQIGIALKVFLL